VKKQAAWTLSVAVICILGFGALWFSKLDLGTTKSRVRSAESIAGPHLQRAEESIANATQTHFQAIETLLERSRSQSPAFAKLALGWGSKWRIVADATPFTRGDRHAEYLKEQFEKQVLKGEELTKAIEQAVTEFLADIRNTESKMLVDLRVDVEDLKSTYNLGLIHPAEVQSHFDAAIENATLVSGYDLQSNISSQLVSIVVGEVLTQVAIRLGVSAGILGTGAATGWVTFGVGVIVGLVIDQIVSAIWTHISDPQKNLEDELKFQLKVMQRMICFGDNDTKGLAQHFEEIAKTRAELRRVAVLKLLGVEPVSIPSTK
jgi:hypothetical protein